jgi:hypothetical protein
MHGCVNRVRVTFVVTALGVCVLLQFIWDLGQFGEAKHHYLRVLVE